MAGVVREDAQVDDLLRELEGVGLGVALAHAEQHEQAGADAETTRPATVTDASRTRCTTALIRPSARTPRHGQRLGSEV